MFGCIFVYMYVYFCLYSGVLETNKTIENFKRYEMVIDSTTLRTFHAHMATKFKAFSLSLKKTEVLVFI